MLGHDTASCETKKVSMPNLKMSKILLCYLDLVQLCAVDV